MRTLHIGLRLFGTALALASVLSGCSDDPELEVQVVTSLVPGVEFTQVEVDRLAPAPLYEGAEVLEGVQSRAAFGDPFVRGKRVAAFTLAAGEHLIQVRLRRPDGRLLIARRTRVVVNDARILRVHLTPDCVGVTCPSPAGSPALSECLAGQCVDERCVPPSSEFCPSISFCNVDTDCPSPVVSCAMRACVEGICQVEPDATACAADEYCDLNDGCTARTVLDAGIGDAGVGDAGEVDAGGSDAGPPVPDGSVCGGLCALESDPCRIGSFDCSSGVAVCAPYALRTVGTSCGTGLFCDAVGDCSACREGAACSVACSQGAIDCSYGYERCVIDTTLESVAPGNSCSATHACVEGDSCDGTSICLADGSCGACSSEGQFCWGDPLETYSGCSYGTRSCAMGGACVVTEFRNEGDGCGMERRDSSRYIYGGVCDAVGNCNECIDAEACDLDNGCGSGVRDCTSRCILPGGDCSGGHGEGYVVGTCRMRDAAVPGTLCADGVCDGQGGCVAPLQAKHIGTSAHFTGGCIVTPTDGVACWAQSPAPDPDPAARATAEIYPIAGLPTTTAQVTGHSHDGCALSSEGEVWCWGIDQTPGLKTLPGDAIHVEGGQSHGCAIVSGGQLYCWGPGYLIGTGDGVDQATPVAVAGLDNIIQVAVGTTSGALRATGEIMSWGQWGSSGRILGTAVIPTYVPGFGNHVLTPVQVDTIDDAISLSFLNSSTACAQRAGNELWCWGSAIGAGAYPYGAPTAPSPLQVPLTYTDIEHLSVVGGAICTLRSTGEYWCFGTWGGLGRGLAGAYGAPGSIVGVDAIEEVSNECGVRSDGSVFCWYVDPNSVYSAGVGTLPILISSSE
ncbi:MAG: hypothetical protein IPK60_05715 [Sandaracinaceae bacterium]|nr:hypothetical protein [Sandaracinaceae bacterium]